MRNEKYNLKLVIHNKKNYIILKSEQPKKSGVVIHFHDSALFQILERNCGTKLVMLCYVKRNQLSEAEFLI